MFPKSRRDGLLFTELDDELVVYDVERHRAHRLNRTAALIWQRADGETSVPALAARVAAELDLPDDEDIVHLALDRLEAAGLLESAGAPAARREGLSRRQLIARLGLAGGALLLVPGVESIAVPDPAAAQSPPPNQNLCIYTVDVVTNPANGDASCGTPAVKKGDTVCGPCVSPCSNNQGFSFTPRSTVSGICTIAVTPSQDECAKCPDGGITLKMCPTGISAPVDNCWRARNT